jgi:CDP-4-dehydro-6-deoxyglucose reductase
MRYNVQLVPSGISFQASDSAPLLESALGAGIHIAYGCRDGNCGNCKTRLVSGNVSQPDDLPGLSREERAAGYILSCRTSPCSAVVLEAEYYPQLAAIRQLVMPCKVDTLEFAAPDVAILRLRLPPGERLDYLPGQYVDLIHGPVRRSYSIANCPHEYDGIELHIRNIAGGKISTLVFEQLQQNQLLRIEGPGGTFFVREGITPLIFVAGGTGFAPVKAMVSRLLHDAAQREIHVYWGAQSRAGLYSKLPQQWQGTHANVNFTPVLSGIDDEWEGRRGLVHKAVLDDFPDLGSYEIYACGAPAMIDAARNDFIASGAKPDKFLSDAFSPSS